MPDFISVFPAKADRLLESPAAVKWLLGNSIGQSSKTEFEWGWKGLHSVGLSSPAGGSTLTVSNSSFTRVANIQAAGTKMSKRRD